MGQDGQQQEQSNSLHRHEGQLPFFYLLSQSPAVCTNLETTPNQQVAILLSHAERSHEILASTVRPAGNKPKLTRSIPALVGAESTLEWTVKVIGGQEYTCYLKIKKEKKGHNCLGSYFNSTGALMKKLEIFESLFLRTTLPCRYKNQSLDNVKANVSYRSVEN